MTEWLTEDELWELLKAEGIRITTEESLDKWRQRHGVEVVKISRVRRAQVEAVIARLKLERSYRLGPRGGGDHSQN